MKIESLKDLFIFKLTALYDIETQIVKALPRVEKAATDIDLKESLSKHLEETKVHVQRLEEIFTKLDVIPKKTKVEAIRGLVADAEWLISQDPSPELLDAVLVASARYVEHYEMAGYLTAIAWAELLNMDDIVQILESTLEEERNADLSLSEVAEAKINMQAFEAGIKSESEDEDE